MSDRVSQTIVLCEDDAHERLIRFYLRKCGLNAVEPSLRVLNASRQLHGGNVGWVIREFPRQLEACRQREKRSKTLLIVMVDADDLAVEDRRRELNQSSSFSDNDPIAVLIPKRHVETWIRAALFQAVDETKDCKKPELKKDEFRDAANLIHAWARSNPAPGPTCVPSLRAALSQWHRIG